MAWNDIAYTIQRSSLYAGFKHLIVEFGGLHDAASVIGSASPAALAFDVSVPVLSTLGLLVAMSAGLSQMDFFHKKNTLKSIYREEASAKLGKPVNRLSKEDFDVLASQNPVLDEEMTQARRQRNFGIALSFAASVASIAMVVLGLPAIGYDHAALAAMHPVAEFLANGLVGVLTYNAVKTPLHWVADKLFDLDKETAHDRILAISHQQATGKAITPGKVLGVYTAANADLDHFIEAKYGQAFDKMKPGDQEKVAVDLGKLVPLERLSQDLSNGRLKATSLALATDGEDVAALERMLAQQPAKPGFFGAMWQKVRGNKPQAQEVTTVTAAPLPGGIAVEYASERPGQSFVERVGVSRTDTPMGHVERLEQARRMTVSQPVPDIG